MQANRNFKFSVYNIFSSLVFARAVFHCSKNKTYHDVLPCLFKDMNYSYDQLLSAVEFIGSEYEKFIEILTVATKTNYGLDTSKTYFDCTNFYFEIDKENRVGMGLLLDQNLIPIGMRMYLGNESENPYIRNELKNQNNITGRTIQVADKGLNCAKNIHNATLNNDGYIFQSQLNNLARKKRNGYSWRTGLLMF